MKWINRVFSRFNQSDEVVPSTKTEIMNKTISRQIIKNVERFIVTPDGLYWIDTNEVVCRNNTEIGYAATYSKLIYHNGVLYAIVDGNDWQTFPPRKSYDFNKQILSIQGNNIIFSYGKFMDETYGVASLSEDNQISILFETRKIQIETITEKILIGVGDNGLTCLNFNDEILWEFPLKQLGEDPYYPGRMDTIEKVLGVVHGNLWFYTRGYRLVALDIKTGEKIFSYDCFGAYLDEKTKNIILLSGNFFEIVDTKALKIKEEYNFLEIDPIGIGSYRAIYVPLLQGDYFTFIGEKENEKNGCGWAGVFDYKARKLVWEYEIITQEERKKTGNQLITPQRLLLSNNKLYIEDFLRNLHIFEVDL